MLNGIRTPRLGTCLLLALAMFAGLPLLAQAVAKNMADTENFGQYLADHQSDLEPFFSENGGELFRQSIPLIMSMLGGVIFFTMLIGWGIDVLMSRGFAYFFAPAYGDWKRCIVYATGRLFLGFLYTCLISLAIILSLGLAHAITIIGIVVIVLLFVAFAAQVVWILYLYRTSFPLSIVFYIVLGLVHFTAGLLLMHPMIGPRAPIIMTNFIDRAITPRLQAAATDANKELVKAKTARDEAKSKVTEFQEQAVAGEAEQTRLHRQIEEKKNSDIYVLAQIVKTRAAGDLAAAHEQLAGFPGRFPTSPLNALAKSQLDQVNQQMDVETARKREQEADQARADAVDRTNLLARAAKGQATLSEMRRALLGKTRSQVSDLLGKPSETASDTWSYAPQMIVNPLTNEHSGMQVRFSVGIVQGVDYYRSEREQ